MPDIDTPDPQAPATPAEIEEWPSGRIPDELPDTTPNPASPDPASDPEDGAVPEPLEAGDANAQPFS